MTYAYVYVHVDVYHYLCLEIHRIYLNEYHLKPVQDQVPRLLCHSLSHVGVGGCQIWWFGAGR